jgi:hypothetical protein
MLRGARFLLGAACALLLLTLAAGGASAARFSESHTEFGLIWTPTFANSVASVSCEGIILTGSFHSRTFAKTAGLLLASFNRASIRAPERCSGGSAEVLTRDLPWHFTYHSFTGTLPRISTIRFRIIGLAIRLTERGGTSCLYRSTTTNPAGIIANIEANGAATSIRSDETLRIPTISGFPCELAGSLAISGSGGGVENPVVFRLI